MPVLDSDFDTRMSPTPPPCFPSLTSTLLSSSSSSPQAPNTMSESISSVLIDHSSGGGPRYPLRRRAKKRACIAGEEEGQGAEVRTPRRPTALQLELAKYPRRASPVKVSSPFRAGSASSSSHSRSASGSSVTTRSTSGGGGVAPGTPRRRASGRGGELSKKQEKMVSTRERIYSPEKGNGKRVIGGVGRSAGRSISESSSTVPLLHAPSTIPFTSIPPPTHTPIYTSTPASSVPMTTSTRSDTYTKPKALPPTSPSVSRKGSSKGYKPLKSPSSPLKSPRSRKATTSPSAKTTSLGGVGGRWGSTNSASMLSVFTRGLKKRIQGKKADKLLLKVKAQAKAETQGSNSKMGGKEDGGEVEGVGEMVISPSVSSIGMACTFPSKSGFQAEDKAWKRRGSVTMVDNQDDDDEQEFELDSDSDNNDTPMSSTLTRSPTAAMQFLSISAPTASNPLVDEDFEMTPASSP